jgi:Protein of unknown function (DUF4100)/Zinc knuckle
LKSERFIESLREYYEEDWDAFKSRLLEFYPSEEEKPYYKVDHLIKLVHKHRKLSSIEKFNNYIREFTLVTTALEEWKALSQTDKYNYFRRGIKPMSFRDEIANVLRNYKQWTDLTNPPPMDEAIQTIKLHLKRDLYHVPEDSELSMMLDAETSLSTTESDDESGSDNSDNESKKAKGKKAQPKVDIKQKKDKGIDKPPETKAQDSGDPMKSNIDDLAEKIGWLTLALGQFNTDKGARRPGRFTASSIKCFMCGEEGHSLKDCPETKAFITKKVLKISNEGHLVQLDSTNLPHGNINNRGVAQILCDQLANASNVKMEHLCSFELLNQEFTTFGEYEYEVFPAKRKKEEVEAKRNEPYLKDEPKGKKSECPNRAYVEIPQHPVRQEAPSLNDKAPTILKQEVRPVEHPVALPNKDIEMRDATMDEPISRKHKGVVEDKGIPTAKSRPKTRPSLENIVVCDKTDQIKKRALPVYCFASELQENVDVEVLYKSLMEKEVTVKLGDILRSSFELCKRLQIATKTQQVPVKSAAARSSNVEAIVNSLEYASESISLDSPMLGGTLAQISEELMEFNPKISSAESVELKPGKPKQPLINHLPKKPHEHKINVISFESEEDSNNSDSDNSEIDTNDQAEEFYRCQLEKEHNRVFNVRESDFSFHCKQEKAKTISATVHELSHEQRRGATESIRRFRSM